MSHEYWVHDVVKGIFLYIILLVQSKENPELHECKQIYKKLLIGEFTFFKREKQFESISLAVLNIMAGKAGAYKSYKHKIFRKF